MGTNVAWLLGIGVAVAILLVAASLNLYYVHMAISAVVGLVIAFCGLREARRIKSRQASLLASSSFRYMGLVWTWGALALLVTYNFALQWREWWQFFIGFVVLAGLCLFTSATLMKDGAGKQEDATMLNVARILAAVLAVAMVITMVGLLVDGKMWRYTTVAGLRPGSQDWAANNVFFFGAMAIAALASTTFAALRKQPH